MSDAGLVTRSAREIRRMLEQLCDVYQLGGPRMTTVEGYAGGMEPYNFHGLVLCELHDPREDLSEFLRGNRIDSYEGLQALLRIVASYAAVNALSWVLEEPAPDAGAGVAGEFEVLGAARAWPTWDDDLSPDWYHGSEKKEE